jgi:hypothetical protein
MAHFAKIENGQVAQVIVVNNIDLDAEGDFPESELSGQAFIDSLGLEGLWIQTSYSGKFRANYAGIGYVYDEDLDAFIPPKPGDDYVLNVTTYQWELPETPGE